MSLFKKKAPEPARPVSCPVCGAGVYQTDLESHWLGHIDQIPAGQGDASGQYTWTCSCGPSHMKWPGKSAAVMSLQYHVARAHGFPTMEEYLLSTLDRQANMHHLRNRLS